MYHHNVFGHIYIILSLICFMYPYILNAQNSPMSILSFNNQGTVSESLYTFSTLSSGGGGPYRVFDANRMGIGLFFLTVIYLMLLILSISRLYSVWRWISTWSALKLLYTTTAIHLFMRTFGFGFLAISTLKTKEFDSLYELQAIFFTFPEYCFIALYIILLLQWVIGILHAYGGLQIATGSRCRMLTRVLFLSSCGLLLITVCILYGMLWFNQELIERGIELSCVVLNFVVVCIGSVTAIITFVFIIKSRVNASYLSLQITQKISFILVISSVGRVFRSVIFLLSFKFDWQQSMQANTLSMSIVSILVMCELVPLFMLLDWRLVCIILGDEDIIQSRYLIPFDEAQKQSLDLHMLESFTKEHYFNNDNDNDNDESINLDSDDINNNNGNENQISNGDHDDDDDDDDDDGDITNDDDDSDINNNSINHISPSTPTYSSSLFKSKKKNKDDISIDINTSPPSSPSSLSNTKQQLLVKKKKKKNNMNAEQKNNKNFLKLQKQHIALLSSLIDPLELPAFQPSTNGPCFELSALSLPRNIFGPSDCSIHTPPKDITHPEYKEQLSAWDGIYAGNYRKKITALSQILFSNPLWVTSVGFLYNGNQRVCVKRFQLPGLDESALRELSIEAYSRCQLCNESKYILPLLGFTITGSSLYLITQYKVRRSLFDILQNTNKNIAPMGIINFAQSIAIGMETMHNNNVIHGHLKSRNVVSDENLNLFITDCGDRFVRVYAEATYGSHIYDQWCAPEVLGGHPATKASDVYSFGVICWELCYRRVPYETLTHDELIRLIGVSKHPLQLELPNEDSITRAQMLQKNRGKSLKLIIPYGFIHLISRCFAAPEARPNFTEIVHSLQNIQEMLKTIDDD